MNLPLGRPFRLVPRGGPGLSCDSEGITLGGVPLARVWSDQGYRIPDARLGKLSIDWALLLKTIDTPQVRGFFDAVSEPDAVVIVRPSRLGGLYLLRRPTTMR